MKCALDLDSDQGMSRENFQGLQIRGLGPAQTKDLGEVEEIAVVLEDKICETVHRKGAGVELLKKRMSEDRAPDRIRAPFELIAEGPSHRILPALRGVKSRFSAAACSLSKFFL